jgi:hypothetical protein
MSILPRFVASVLPFVLAVSVSAQGSGLDPLQFAPLDVGNRWEYVYQNEMPTPAVPIRYIVAEIASEMLIGGEPHRVLTQQSFALDGTPDGPLLHCAYSLTSGPASAEAAGLPDYNCDQLSAPPVLPYPYGPTTVRDHEAYEVSGQTYIADTLVSYGSQTMGSGGAMTAWARAFVRGVGHLSTRTWGRRHATTCTTTPSACDFADATRLVFARVGGAVYGASVVAGDEGPRVPSALQLRAWPNPSGSGGQALRVEGATGRTTTTVFDILGRQVWREVSPRGTLTLPVLTPGVYTVRVTDDASRQGAIRIVRR